jgi:NDP-sugar pyrophosphorylase family protein
MRPFTESIPKVLIRVAGEPFLDHQLRWLSTHGVSEVVLSLGYRGEMVEAHLTSGSSVRPGISVRCVHEGSSLRGTAGALRLAHDLGVLADEFLVTNGDSYLPIDFGAVGAAFHRCGRSALMTVFRNEGRWDRSNVVFDSDAGLVTLYDKARGLRSAHEFKYIDYGLSALRRETIAREIPSNAKHDLADLFHALSLSGDLAGFEVQQRFFEIGSHQGLADLEAHLLA